MGGWCLRFGAVWPSLVVIAVGVGVVDALGLRSGDNVTRIVNASAAVEHSQVLLKALIDADGDGGTITLPNVASSELEQIVEFMNTVPHHEVNVPAYVLLRH